ncbi:hypothetical protein CYMTET_23402, partial [Cymbomonas tetramitiformis]
FERPRQEQTTPGAAASGLLLAAQSGAGTWYCHVDVTQLEEDLGAEAFSKSSWHMSLVEDSMYLRDGVLCISDHESWARLPLASGMSEMPTDVMPLCCGSLCKYAAVALGAATAFVQHPVEGHPTLKVWDHAAGVICVEEAGGCVTDFAGRPLQVSGCRTFIPSGLGVLVTNRHVHAELVTGITLAYEMLPDAKPTGPLLVLLDRDGVINHDLGTWVKRPEDLELMPGAAAAVASLNAAGHHVAVVTNQSCVGRGLISTADLEKIHNRLEAVCLCLCPRRRGAVATFRALSPRALQSPLSLRPSKPSLP